MLNKYEVEAYRRRVNLHPEDPKLHFELGVILARIGEHDEAIAEFQQARSSPALQDPGSLSGGPELRGQQRPEAGRAELQGSPQGPRGRRQGEFPRPALSAGPGLRGARQQRGGRGALQRSRRHRLRVSRRRRAAESLELTAKDMVCSSPLPRRVAVSSPGPLAGWLIVLDQSFPNKYRGAMPNSPSAAKRMRQSAKRRLHNRVTKKVIKTLTKTDDDRRWRPRISKKPRPTSRRRRPRSTRPGARRVLHPNTAARRKSKLARAYNAAVAKAKQA